MDALNALTGSYSLGDAVVFIIVLVILSKTVGQAFEWGWNKIRSRVVKDVEDGAGADALARSIDAMRTQLDGIEVNLSNIYDRIEHTDSRLQALEEHTLQITRAFFVEKYYYYCKERGVIDESGLQVLEVRYAFYKAHGGNSYVDSIMEEIRALPRVSVYDSKVVDILKHEGVLKENG